LRVIRTITDGLDAKTRSAFLARFADDE